MSLNRGWAVAVLLSVCGFFAAGGVLWQVDRAGIAEGRVRRLVERGELKLDQPVEVWGVVSRSPELAPDRIYLSLEVEKVAAFGRESPASGLIQIVAPFDDGESRVEYDRLALDYGSRLRLWCRLSNRRGYRNPGAPDLDALLEDRGYDAAGVVKSPLLIERLGAGTPNRLRLRLYHLRDRALTRILRDFTQPTSGILAAALFGNRHFLSQGTAERFRAGGTFHLLVISGLHVAMIALAALKLSRMLSRSRFVQSALVLALIWAYTLMVGGEPAIARAAIMLSLVLVGQSIFRASNGPNMLAASAIVLLVRQPRDLFNPAFQLSFLTVLMIVVVSGPLYVRLREIGQWQPSASTPYPPRVPGAVRWWAEVLFWNERAFREEMRESRIRYRLDKSRLAGWLSRSRLQQPLAWIGLTIFTTTGVQAGLLPLMINQFHRVSIVSPVTNVIESLLLFALMIAGMLYLVVRSFLGEMALTLAVWVDALGLLTVRASDWLLKWKYASWRVPDLGHLTTPVNTVYFGAVLILIIVISEWNPFRRGDEPGARRRRVIGRTLAGASSFAIVVLGGLLMAHPFKHRSADGRLSLTFLDVGQGDAMLISFPRGALLMLDAGGRPSFESQDGESRAGESPRDPWKDHEAFVEDRLGIAEAAVMPFLWSLGIKRLDRILASHGDADHVEGFTEVVRNFEVGWALKGPVSRTGGRQSLFDRAVDGAKLPVQVIKRGDSLEVDGARIEVLAPFDEVRASSRSTNNDSVVLRITFGGRRFLLTGDIEKEIEGRLADSDTDLRADVLKVAHHGSKTSSTLEFLTRVRPAHMVISVASPSPYGHPHPEVIERLNRFDARIWRTSECGAITISTDGQDLRVETFVKCE
jgi:competence protein ComEC